jgi:hypothetical protein|tara:strand:+ start:4245 stop:4859 length:615 start_codon:yes stop_codon:yes gene_type:complete
MPKSSIPCYAYTPSVIDYMNKKISYKVIKNVGLQGSKIYFFFNELVTFYLYLLILGTMIYFIAGFSIFVFRILWILPILIMPLYYWKTTSHYMAELSQIKINRNFDMRKYKIKRIEKLKQQSYKIVFSGDYIDWELYKDYKDIKYIESGFTHRNYPKKKFRWWQIIRIIKHQFKISDYQKKNKMYMKFVFNQVPKSGYMLIKYF